MVDTRELCSYPKRTTRVFLTLSACPHVYRIYPLSMVYVEAVGLCYAGISLMLQPSTAQH